MNNKIDISLWERFTLGSLFDIVKGTRLTKSDMKEGNINYIGASAFKNGITYHIGNNDHLHPAGTLTVCYNGSIGQTFYQPEPFWATDDVNVLYPKFKITKYIALFIAPLIKIVGKNYQYTDKWQIEDMKKSCIYLPVDKEGKPDWMFMDSYMRKISSKAKRSIDALNSSITPPEEINNQIDISRWESFKISDYFFARNTGNVLSRDVCDGTGTTPYVTASNFNNGVVAQIDASKYSVISGHCILVGGKTFSLTYQEKDFVSNDSHNFYLRFKENKSIYVYLFIITILRKSFSSKYTWGDAVTKEKLLDQKIKLPVREGKPDWELMENWIKKFYSKAKLSMNLLNR